MLWNKRDLAFPIIKHYISCALKQQATWHACKVLEGQSYIEQDNCFFFIITFVKRLRDNCLFPSLKKSQIQNVSPAIMDEVQGIRLWFMKMLFQIILMFECRVTLWASILLFTIMEQHMLCAGSETKGIWLFPSWSITYLVL